MKTHKATVVVDGERIELELFLGPASKALEVIAREEKTGRVHSVAVVREDLQLLVVNEVPEAETGKSKVPSMLRKRFESVRTALLRVIKPSFEFRAEKGGDDDQWVVSAAETVVAKALEKKRVHPHRVWTAIALLKRILVSGRAPLPETLQAIVDELEGITAEDYEA